MRVSSDQQAESGLSLEHQQEKCRQLASLQDYDLADVIVDAGESAKSLDRPGMGRVLELVRGKQIDAVIVTKLDRLTRSVRDLADILDLFQRRHVALVSVSESLNTETAGGRMVVNLLGVVGQWEREAIGERTRDALRTKRRRGERCGELAYGWQLGQDGRTLEPNHSEREMILYAVEMRQAGNTWRAIAETLNRQGYRNRAGRPWRLDNLRYAVLTLYRHQEERAARN